MSLEETSSLWLMDILFLGLGVGLNLRLELKEKSIMTCMYLLGRNAFD